jgi:putative peptidoglycan lipid II flippase
VTAGTTESERSDGIVRAGGVMAMGTLASRATGFLRVAAVAAALGLRTDISNSYNVANTIPNIVYELLLGGVLTSVVVPLLVKAAHDDEDGGTAFGQLLLTLVSLLLGTAIVVAMLAAPWIVAIYDRGGGEQRQLEVTFLRFFLPQILFYGLGATIGAILNTRGRFGAPMLTPVLNNLVVIATAGVFAALPSAGTPSARTLSTAQTVTLGVGTTLGVVVMTVALLPSLRATGFRWSWRLNLRHPGLRSALRLGVWVFCYVAVNQVGYAVVVRLSKDALFFTAYFSAFQLFQLPHAIVTVSVISALLPQLSRHAVEGRLDRLREDLARGLRLSLSLVVPAALAYVALARPISVVIFQHGRTDRSGALLLAGILAGFAIGLPFFSAFQLQLRAFYAMHDSRTPALVNIAVNAAMVAVDLVLFFSLDGDARAVGLALGNASSYLVGLVIFSWILRGRLGGLDGPAVVRAIVRITLAASLAALPAYAVSQLIQGWLGSGLTGSSVATAAGLLIAGGGYLALASRMRVGEVAALGSLVRGRFAR